MGRVHHQGFFQERRHGGASQGLVVSYREGHPNMSRCVLPGIVEGRGTISRVDKTYS